LQKAFFATLYPADDTGYLGVTIPGANVNGQGRTAAEAIQNATEILQSVIDDLSAAGEPLPEPADFSELEDAPGSFRCVIMANLPTRAVRVNITLPDSLLARIDAVANNRSAFLAESALARLRQG
jgi:predicted RNase H-like HicB family nuclease